MAPQVGVSLYLANSWIRTLRNEPFTIPLVCVRPHVGIPGADGLLFPSAITARQACAFSVAEDGITLNITGTPPTWLVSNPELLSHISAWSGFENDPTAKFLFSAVMLPARQVADKDVFNLGTCSFAFAPNVLAAS